MNDRFKFRVWDKRLNRYLGEYDPTLLLMSDGNIAYLDDKAMENYTIEQSTGLKDKNGTLIYEGDIVKYTSKRSNKNPEKEPYTENYQVVWEEKYTGYNLQSNKKVNCFNLGIMTDDIEVIGNIYESKIPDGRSETSPDSEQMEQTGAKPRQRHSVSVEEFQDNKELLYERN